MVEATGVVSAGVAVVVDGDSGKGYGYWVRCL